VSGSVPKRILLSGATGFVGGALKRRFEELGAEVVPLTRKPLTTPHVPWNPPSKPPDPAKIGGFDAVVHLAGANVAEGRWTEARKRELWESRVDATKQLCRALIDSGSPPKTFVAASAIGYYGDRGDEHLDDSSPRGQGFLPDLAEAWETASVDLEAVGVRVCRLRLGVVLDPSGALLGKLLSLFRWGLGGRLGTGKQWISWVSREDVMKAFVFALERPLRGTFTLTSPNPVTNAEFTKALATAVHRPAIVPAPAFGLRLAFGEMADELMLSSTRAIPSGLLKAGFEFRHPRLETFLRDVL
jgi:uncharacterized protein (TIGR01777 family)